MTGPLFNVGDLVRMVRVVGHATYPAETFFEAVGSVIPGGVFKVMTVLPEQDGQPQYRIRGGNPEHERRGSSGPDHLRWWAAAAGVTTLSPQSRKVAEGAGLIPSVMRSPDTSAARRDAGTSRSRP